MRFYWSRTPFCWRSCINVKKHPEHFISAQLFNLPMPRCTSGNRGTTCLSVVNLAMPQLMLTTNI